MSEERDQVQPSTVSAAGLLIGAGVIGVVVGAIVWFGARDDRHPNYAPTIVVLVISAVLLVCGVILVAGRTASGTTPTVRDTRPIVERMNDRIQRD